MGFLALMIIFLHAIILMWMLCISHENDWSINKIFWSLIGVVALLPFTLFLLGINPDDYSPDDPLEQIEKLEERVIELEKSK